MQASERRKKKGILKEKGEKKTVPGGRRPQEAETKNFALQARMLGKIKGGGEMGKAEKAGHPHGESTTDTRFREHKHAKNACPASWAWLGAVGESRLP